MKQMIVSKVNLLFNQNVSWVAELLRSKLLRNFSIQFLAQGACLGLGFLVNIMVMRKLGPADFGLYSLFVATLVIGGVLTGSGMDIAIVRLAAPYIQTDIRKSFFIFKAGLKIRMAIALSMTSLAFFLAPLINALINRSELNTPIWFALVGGLGSTLVAYLLAIFQSYEHFGKWAAISLMSYGTRALILSLLFFLYSLNLPTVLTIYVASFFVALTFGLTIIDKKFLSVRGEGERQALMEIINFSKWTIVTSIIYSIYTRADVFILTYFKDAQAVGMYAAAATFIIGLDLAMMSLFTVLIPKASKMERKADYMAYIKKWWQIVFLFLLLWMPLLIFSRPLVLGVCGSRYEPSIALLRVLLVGSFFFLFIYLAEMVFYPMNKPQIITFTDSLLFVVNLGLLLLLIPRYGGLGAAYANMSGRLIGSVLYLTTAYFQISKLKE